MTAVAHQQIGAAGLSALVQVEAARRCAPSRGRRCAPSSAMTNAGRAKRSTSLAATMPTTPACQPSPATTSAGRRVLRLGLLRAPRRARAPARRGARGWRPRTPAARSRGVRRSSASSRSSASCASPRRPGALSRGASRSADVGGALHAVVEAGDARTARPAPGRGARAQRAAGPWCTRMRFSSVSGARSAMVPTATRSSERARIGQRVGAAAVAQAGAQRRRQVEGDADRGQPLEGEAAAPAGAG